MDFNKLINEMNEKNAEYTIIKKEETDCILYIKNLEKTINKIQVKLKNERDILEIKILELKLSFYKNIYNDLSNIFNLKKQESKKCKEIIKEESKI